LVAARAAWQGSPWDGWGWLGAHGMARLPPTWIDMSRRGSARHELVRLTCAWHDRSGCGRLGWLRLRRGKYGLGSPMQVCAGYGEAGHGRAGCGKVYSLTDIVRGSVVAAIDAWGSHRSLLLCPYAASQGIRREPSQKCCILTFGWVLLLTREVVSLMGKCGPGQPLR
jgi:hypothetical protein